MMKRSVEMKEVRPIGCATSMECALILTRTFAERHILMGDADFGILVICHVTRPLFHLHAQSVGARVAVI